VTARRNQNSILVLANLGVYLGLVMAGAAPQVLANAAMTRHFDVRDEIEFSDNLDNKPDDGSKEAEAAVQEYLSRVKTLINDLGGLQRALKITPSDEFSSSRIYYVPCDAAATPIVRTFRVKKDPVGVLDGVALNSLRPSDNWSRLSTCSIQDGALGQLSLRSEAAASLNHNSLLFTASITRSSQADAEQLAHQLAATFELYRSGDSATDLLIKNTQLQTAENHVVIITNLPRSDLEPLLSSDAQ
jgi:hypothetical protein